MRHIITIIFICSTTIIFGQRLFFAGNAVDTLKINSNSSYYHFDTCGTSTGTKDEYVIVFENSTNQYVIDTYQRTEYKVTFKPNNSSSKSKILAKRQKIKNDFLNNLLTELQTKSVPPNFNNIGLTVEMFNKLTDKKHIIKIAKSQGWGLDEYRKSQEFSSLKNKEIESKINQEKIIENKNCYIIFFFFFLKV